MSQVRLFTATSLDGFVADMDGDSTWLDPYANSMFGETGFIETIGAVILGRRTFQMMQAFGDWPYDDKYAFVLTSQEPSGLPPNAYFVTTGIAAAVQAARERTAKDIWVVGGAITMQSALEAGLVDIVEICIVPKLIGSGLSMLNSLDKHQNLEFEGIQAYSDGLVKLRYEVIEQIGQAVRAIAATNVCSAAEHRHASQNFQLNSHNPYRQTKQAPVSIKTGACWHQLALSDGSIRRRNRLSVHGSGNAIRPSASA